MTPVPDPPARFTLVIQAVRDPLHNQGVDRTPEYRLKGVLKGLLRGFGFRCVRITPDSVVATPTPAGVASPSPSQD